MILYTPLCETDVFPNDDHNYSNRKCVTHQGKLLYVEKTDDGSYQLLQLLSTNPQDYLDANYSPGNTLTLS